MEQTIVLRKEEEEILQGIMAKGNNQSLLEWFVSNSDLEMKEAILIRNRIATEADEMKLLHAILTGDYKIAYDYRRGDILVRTKDRPAAVWKGDTIDREGDFIEVAVASDRGVTDTKGDYHRLTNVRPATDLEKKFHALGRKRVEFIAGDHVHTLAGSKLVGGFLYSEEDAMNDLEENRITGFYPRESRIEIR